VNNWKETTLGKVCSKIGSGATPRGGQDSYKEDGIALIRSQNVLDLDFNYSGLAFIDQEQADDLANVEVQKEDVLINITGDSVARVCMVPDAVLPARVNQHVSILRANSTDLYPYYLKYYLINRSIKQSLLNVANSGATRNALTKGQLENFPIPLPPLSEQKAIAAILSSFDDKIELLRRQNKTLEQIAQAIFKEWFIKFIVNGKKQKVNSSTGLPEGWRMGKLGEEFKIIMGQSPDGASYNESGEGMIFFQGRAEFQERFPATRLFTTAPKKIAENFDVLVSVRAPVGDINVAFDKCCIGRGLAAVSGKYKSYALYKIRSLKDAFNKFEGEGTVFGSIGKDSFANIESTVPDSETIKSFEMITDPIDAKIYNNYSQIQTLSKLRDALLPKLMKGEIRVKT
jgi:type I restriction enzyme S subunit